MARRTFGVSAPRGLLRLLVLREAAESPVSGTTLMATVEHLTRGVWRPSPGSIYLLLRSLAQEGLLIEVLGETGGERRYIITAKGRRLLAEAEGSGLQELGRLLAFTRLLARVLKAKRIEKQLEKIQEDL
jgi:DNA-binding PadR family transcriptional regulator